MPLQTFDRSKELEAVAADLCFPGIEKLCHVKISTFMRGERTMFGGLKRVRLLAISGAEKDIALANWIYGIIDDTIGEEAKRFQKSNRNSGPVQTHSFETGLAERINARLLGLDDGYDIGHEIALACRRSA